LLVTGLTGGIASGKSTVSRMFREAGAELIDADEIAREVVKQGNPAWSKIKAHFGEEILLPDGEINRDLLGKIIFHDHSQKKELNRIVHPLVFQKIEMNIVKVESGNPNAIVILDVPLLIETGIYHNLSEIILVYIPENLQLERLIARDHISEIDAKARICSQMPIDEKKQFATILIDNSNCFEKTKEKVLDVFQILLEKEKAEKKPGRFHLSIPHEAFE
jgi:dephospho-CoA kinase